MEDKRIRYLIIAVKVVVLVLVLLSLVSTAFQVLVPLAVIGAIAFAFYKIVLEGRDSDEVMEDEMAETTAVVLAEASAEAADENPVDADDQDDSGARQRLSAVERARSDFFDTATPAEEILDQIQSRKRRLKGQDEA